MSCTLKRGMAENFIGPCDLIFTMPYAALNYRVRKTPMIVVGYKLRQPAYEMWINHKLDEKNLLGYWGAKREYAVWVVNAPKFDVNFDGLVMEKNDTFPIELPRRILAAYPGKKVVVADPFMGRGTVGAAVVEYGGTFLGIDRVQEALQSARSYLTPPKEDAAA